MRKKQNAKARSKTNKKQIVNLAEKTEQILLTMPRIIAAQIGKDLVELKKQGIKLKDELNKGEMQKKKLTVQLVALKKKNTPATRKRLKTIQKALQKTTQQISLLTRGIDTLKKQVQVLSHRKDKYQALQAQLMKFGKEWAKMPSKALRSSKKVKTKSKSSARKSTVLKSVTGKAARYFPETGIMETVELPVRTELTQEPVENI